ncbi:MAG: patatin-like phospholipase family protein [Syntrophobacteraceae bacterium]
MKCKFLTFPIILLLALSACAHYPRNAALSSFDRSAGYRFSNLAPLWNNSDDLFVILTFSGGGTRAMAMSYGVMEKLKETGISWHGGERSLLDEVDIISSVSGGSITAAYYGLYGDRLFQDFSEKILYRNIKEDLLREVFSPRGWFRISSSDFSRTDLTDEYYDREFFQGATFGDMRKERPFILINATDMIQGVRFEFSQDQFDLLCGDLSKLHVSRAVTASTSFPVIFAPMRLDNHAGQCGYQPPEWLIRDYKEEDMSTGLYDQSRMLMTYLDSKRRPFIKLVDGGVSDTIALRGPLYALIRGDCLWSLQDKIKRNAIKKLLVIIVNAKAEPDDISESVLSRFGLAQNVKRVTVSVLQNYSSDTTERINDLFSQWKKAETAYAERCAYCERNERGRTEHCVGEIYPEGRPPYPQTSLVHLRFDSLQDDSERQFLNSIGTGLALPRESIDRVRAAAKKLLDDSPQFQDFLHSLQ